MNNYSSEEEYKSDSDIIKEFIIEDFLTKNVSTSSIFEYDSQISSIALNKEFFNDIKKLM